MVPTYSEAQNVTSRSFAAGRRRFFWSILSRCHIFPCRKRDSQVHFHINHSTTQLQSSHSSRSSFPTTSFFSCFSWSFNVDMRGCRAPSLCHSTRSGFLNRIRDLPSRILKTLTASSISSWTGSSTWWSSGKTEIFWRKCENDDKFPPEGRPKKWYHIFVTAWQRLRDKGTYLPTSRLAWHN